MLTVAWAGGGETVGTTVERCGRGDAHLEHAEVGHLDPLRHSAMRPHMPPVSSGDAAGGMGASELRERR